MGLICRCDHLKCSVAYTFAVPSQGTAAWGSQPSGSASPLKPADGSGSGDVRLRVAALEAALAAAHAETKRLTVTNEELVIARNTMLHDMQVCMHNKACCNSANAMFVVDSTAGKHTQERSGLVPQFACLLTIRAMPFDLGVRSLERRGLDCRHDWAMTDRHPHADGRQRGGPAR